MSVPAALYVHDDAQAREFEPFALTRPVSTLVAGAFPIAQRLELALSATIKGAIAAAHLDDFDEPGAPTAASGVIPRGSVIANARFAPALALGSSRQARESRTAPAVWRAGGRVVAVRLDRELAVAELKDGTRGLESLTNSENAMELEGWWMDEVWDFIRHLPAQLTDDLTRALAL